MLHPTKGPLGPVVLEGRWIRLEPLTLDHEIDLAEAAQDAAIWDWMSQDLRVPAVLGAWVRQGVDAAVKGSAYVFVVRETATGRCLGSTRYLDIAPDHRTVEIGHTWYTPSAWGTHVNPEAKLLLLRHAFETWGARRVQLKTDHRNAHSQAAIRKLGAQYEGTLRNHMLARDGSTRHTVLFSIIAEEWPAIRERLTRRLEDG